MGLTGFEPVTSCMSSKRANQLRQRPGVEEEGFEPSISPCEGDVFPFTTIPPMEPKGFEPLAY